MRVFFFVLPIFSFFSRISVFACCVLLVFRCFVGTGTATADVGNDSIHLSSRCHISG